MPVIINRSDAPDHLFDIPELDFSGDLFAERLGGPWFRLGAWTIEPRRDEREVEDVVERQSILIDPECFAKIFETLDSIDNVLGRLGKPSGSVHYVDGEKEYRYSPFHQFDLTHDSAIGEPLVFRNPTSSGFELIINPDLWLFFELVEKAHGNGIWWDPRKGVDAIVQRVIGSSKLEVVEIRVDYLSKYLQSRQKTLLVGHYRHLHLFAQTQRKIDAFANEDVTLGSPEQGAKVVVQNWGLQRDPTPFLQRRLHLWIEIRPPAINVDDPWADQPPFDPYMFTLPTRVGPVAPARWTRFRGNEVSTFEGSVCDFMDCVWFRQEVLTKYEGASGFEIADNGSVSCHHYWGLNRSTARIGNELLATAIGDFAEGVPFEEWPHWKQYAVEPPSQEAIETLRDEQTVADAVNSLVQALDDLNYAFEELAGSLGVTIPEPLWQGSLNSLAARQLKWVYPATADDDEFMKRATLASTLVLEALKPASLRKLLIAIYPNLHMIDETPPRPLGSRNLLQRLTLIATLFEEFQADIVIIPSLVKQAEGKAHDEGEPELLEELESAYRRLRDEFAPLAFLYDLRTYGGLAHAPNNAQASKTAVQLGLPEKNWHRSDYLLLLKVVADSLRKISKRLDGAIQAIIKRSG
ncbi:MAG TPA: hypothetical protein PK916_08770 [Bacteroidota bacterium]|nr:hypothetical protein [Bacteroidota bacterium]